MKYIGSASAVFLLSALLLSGCNAGRPAVPAKTAAVEEENTQKEKAPALQAARLGDTLDIWTAAYGAPAGDTVYMKRFNNGTVTVIVFKEHIVNITLSDPAGPSASFKTQRKNRMKKAATKQKCTPAFLSKRPFPCRKESLL